MVSLASLTNSVVDIRMGLNPRVSRCCDKIVHLKHDSKASSNEQDTTTKVSKD